MVCYRKNNKKIISIIEHKRMPMLKIKMIPRSEAISISQLYFEREKHGNNSIDHVCKASTSFQSVEMMLENLMIMLNQEHTYYHCDDYFNNNNYKIDHGKKKQLSKIINESCRWQICEWTYRVADYFHIDREIAYMSISYLDRFMTSHIPDRLTYKLAATTTLLLAVKVHCAQKIDFSGIILDLSRGEFGIDDISKMELVILQSLSWRINPPTPTSFLITFLTLGLLSSSSDQKFDFEGIQDFAIFFVELSVCDYYFVTKKQSIVAMAAILNGMEGLGLWTAPYTKVSRRFNNQIMSKFVSDICKFSRINHDCEAIVNARIKIWELYERSEEFSLQNKLKVVNTDTVSNKFGTNHRCTGIKKMTKQETPTMTILSPKSVLT